jgi:hypothetical protein
MAVEFLTQVRRCNESEVNRTSTNLSDAIPTEAHQGDVVRVYTAVESSDGLEILDLLLEWEEDLTGQTDLATL